MPTPEQFQLRLRPTKAYKILGFTGPRDPPCDRLLLLSNIQDHLRRIRPDCLISGMALGSDLLAAKAALDLQVHLIAAVPGTTQTNGWTDAQREYRQRLLDHPNCEIIMTHSGPCTPKSYKDRNIFIVDSCDEMLGVIPNKYSSGTGHATRYAQSKNKQFTSIDPRKLTVPTAPSEPDPHEHFYPR